MDWKEVTQKIRSTLLGRDLASPRRRLSALERIDKLVEVHCPEVKADPAKITRYSRAELIVLLSRSNGGRELNAAERSIVTNLYQVINGEGMRSRVRGSGRTQAGDVSDLVPPPDPSVHDGNDETYVIDLCDQVLGMTASRQHRFDFLRGDARAGGQGMTLPVDAYYPLLKLVVEYRERQHTEAVDHFDKPDRPTVSGVHRGEQRRLYDQRRRDVLPRHGISMVELSFDDFSQGSRKRLRRDKQADRTVVKDKLKRWAR